MAETAIQFLERWRQAHVYAELRALERLDETVAECIGASTEDGISADDLESRPVAASKNTLRGNHQYERIMLRSIPRCYTTIRAPEAGYVDGIAPSRVARELLEEFGGRNALMSTDHLPAPPFEPLRCRHGYSVSREDRSMERQHRSSNGF